MKFKVGDKVKVFGNHIGIITDVNEDDKKLPYGVTVNGIEYRFWEPEFGETELVPYSEKGEKTEMPKQKDLYDFDNMTDDDLDKLISEANEVLMSRKKDRMFEYLDNAINAINEFLRFDGNCAMTSNGYSGVDVINELKELKAYYN